MNRKLAIEIDQRVDKRAYMLEWRKQSRDHCNTWSKQYRQRTPEKQLLRRVKARAKEQNLPFNLSEADISIPKYCPILEIKLEMAGENRGAAPSVDKLIPERGYVKGNISIISNRANTLKNNMSLEEIIRMAEWATNVR